MHAVCDVFERVVFTALELEMDVAACCGLEHLLGRFVEVVETKTASKKRREMGKGEKMSRGADSRRTECCSVLEHREGLVLLKALRQVFSTLSAKVIQHQTANDDQRKASTGADSRRRT